MIPVHFRLLGSYEVIPDGTDARVRVTFVVTFTHPSADAAHAAEEAMIHLASRLSGQPVAVAREAAQAATWTSSYGPPEPSYADLRPKPPKVWPWPPLHWRAQLAIGLSVGAAVYLLWGASQLAIAMGSWFVGLLFGNLIAAALRWRRRRR